MALLFLGLLALWGLFMILKPEVLWGIEHRDPMERERPTEKYINKIRTGGVICIGVAVFLLVCYFR